MIKTRLIKLLSRDRKYIVWQVLWQWLALLVQIAAVFTIAGLIEGKGSRTGAAAVFAAVLVIRVFCDQGVARASYRASVDVKRVLREQIYGKLLRLGVSYREHVSTSEVVQLCTDGVEQLETYFGKYLSQLFYSLLAPLTLFIVVAPISLRAAIVLLVFVPLIPLSIVAVQKIAKKLLNRYWDIYTGLGDSFLENLQGLTTLKIYQADGLKAEEMDAEAQEFRRITMKVLTMQLNSTSVMDIVAYGGAALGMVMAAGQYVQGALSLGQTVAIILLAAEFFLPLRQLGSFFHIAMNGMAASDKIFRLLDLPEPQDGIAAPPSGEISLSLEGVHFSYDGEREILKGLDLVIPAGSFVSLVGESGCGKSTVAGILTGKNRGYTGQVCIGGRPLSELKESEWMAQVTLVRHDSYLFKGTVRENLLMARPEATEEEMQAALARVNLLDFLETQRGLETELLEQAGNLSGGQRQRLAMARALLHDTPVYIFDEATSNIDAESEERILEVIRELARSRTVLMISHRLYNVVESDCIYRMEDGCIREAGTHAELMVRRGGYFRLYESQRELEEYGLARDGEAVSV
ncbi:MAG: ABC transporter ATP-binding protein/permease [Lachnospiraceae bacterium]|nr:ABC transporter ATP-binding protein/permease [Lachnospiraceae bacterium]